MIKQEYYKLLKDPRWQKKRLEVMERDHFGCVNCGDNESTLNIHHLIYFPNKKPWEYRKDLLITLCEECHNEEKEYRKESIKALEEAVASCHFLAEDIFLIGLSLNEMEPNTPPAVVADMISITLSNKFLFGNMQKMYEGHLKKINKQKKKEPF